MLFALQPFLRTLSASDPAELRHRNVLFNGRLRIGVRRFTDSCCINTVISKTHAMTIVQQLASEACTTEMTETGIIAPDLLVPDHLKPEEIRLKATTDPRPCNLIKRARVTSQVDMFQTPEEAIYAFVLNLPVRFRPLNGRKLTVWDPFAGIGENPFGKVLRTLGYTVIESDIQTRPDFAKGVHQGLDFFSRGAPCAENPAGLPTRPLDENNDIIPIDLILTNPPYSETNRFLARLQELNISWAALLPLTTAESKRRVPFLDAMNVHLWTIPNRVNYTLAQDMGVNADRVKAPKSMPFNTSWFSSLEGDQPYWSRLGDVPRLPWSIEPFIAKRCFEDLSRTYTVMDLGQQMIDEFYHGAILQANGTVTTRKTGTPSKKTQSITKSKKKKATTAPLAIAHPPSFKTGVGATSVK